MAITAPIKQSDFSGFITPEMAAPIFERARQVSVVQQLVPQVPLSYKGESVPVTTTKPVANWVDEAATKPATQGAMTLKTITPKKLAAIMVNSAEVVRANPGGYITKMRADLAEAFARAFDYATLHDLGGDGTGTGPFTTYIDQTTKSVELGGNTQANGGVHTDLVDALTEVIGDTDATGINFDFTGWAFDALVEPRFWRATDTTGQPIWTNLPTNDVAPGLAQRGLVLGRPSFMGRGVRNATSTILGYGGDWSQAVWGVVGGINYDVSDQATVTINGSLVSLWENNLVAIRAEAEYGFLVNDTDAFVQLRNDSGS